MARIHTSASLHALCRGGLNVGTVRPHERSMFQGLLSTLAQVAEPTGVKGSQFMEAAICFWLPETVTP